MRQSGGSGSQGGGWPHPFRDGRTDWWRLGCVTKAQEKFAELAKESQAEGDTLYGASWTALGRGRDPRQREGSHLRARLSINDAFSTFKAAGADGIVNEFITSGWGG